MTIKTSVLLPIRLAVCWCACLPRNKFKCIFVIVVDRNFGFCAGFESGILKACCGGEGPYNCNKSVQCGSVGARVYGDPSKCVNWDGFHLTEAANKIIANALIQEHYRFFFPATRIISNTTYILICSSVLVPLPILIMIYYNFSKYYYIVFPDKKEEARDEELTQFM